MMFPEQLIRISLPFFFVLAVVYGVLSATNIFRKNSVCMVISLVFAFFSITHDPFMDFFLANFGTLLWVLIGVFLFLVFSEAFGLRGKEKEKGRELLPMGTLSALIVICITFATQITGFEVPILGGKNFLIVALLILFAAIFYFAYESCGT